MDIKERYKQLKSIKVYWLIRIAWKVRDSIGDCIKENDHKFQKVRVGERREDVIQQFDTSYFIPTMSFIHE